MSKPRIFVTQKIFPQAIALLSREAEVAAFSNDRPMSASRLIAQAKNADGILVFVTDLISAKVLAGWTRVKIVSNFAVGYDNVDVNEATRRGIFLCNTPDVLTEAAADLTWALALATVRNIVNADRYVREGRFRSWQAGLFLGLDLPGKILGIVGLGRIGAAVARRAKASGMNIVYFDPSAKPVLERELGARFVSLKELLKISDIVSLHCRLNETTRHLIGAAQLALMKPSAYLLNTSRGPVVDERALVRALKTEKIAGAGLDVYEKEPSLAKGLAELDNAILLPHIASAGKETRIKMALAAAQNLIAFFRGAAPPPNCVNPEAARKGTKAFFLASLASLASLAWADPLCLKGAIHVHSHRSFDSKGSFEDIAGAAQAAGLDFVILTDHPVLDSTAAWKPPPASGNLIWIDGVEVQLEKRHQLAVLGPAAGRVTWRKDNEMDGLRQAKSLGAVIFLAHLAYSPRFLYPELLDGVEIFNPHISPWRSFSRWPRRIVLAWRGKLESLWIDLIEAHSTEINIWSGMAKTQQLGITAGNDSHQNLRLFGRQVDPYEISLRLVATYVWVEEKSEAAILAALQSGQSYIAFPLIEEARGFRFEMANGDIQATLPGPTPGLIKIFHDGKLLRTSASALSIRIPSPAQGLYRTEVWRVVNGKKKPWIYSNIIRIKM
ncbi:MAG: NAD(P)-dependent oxidoreductase [Elusimicrobiota bacterium]